MNVAAIRKAAPARGNSFYAIRDMEGRDWIGGGVNIYYANGATISEDVLKAIFAKDEDDAKKYSFTVVPTFDRRISLNSQREEEIELRAAGIVYDTGELYWALTMPGSAGEPGEMVFARDVYIKPCARKNTALEFFARMDAERGMLIAVYADLFPCAFIVPEPGWRARQILDALNEVGGLALLYDDDGLREDEQLTLIAEEE